MPSRFSDSHIAEYYTFGYTVLRGILPPSLLSDLRRATDRARQLARERHGPQTQRLQPVGAYDLEERPFRDYAELPALNEAIRNVLTPAHYHGDPEILGVLLEPAEAPWCCGWHRDIREDSKGIDAQEFHAFFHDLNYFNQVNCALYEDTSLWFVPGSHRRPFDLPAETEAAWMDDAAGQGDRSHAALELRWLDYCRRMPGAVCLHLNAGDFAFYRSLAWHLGNYVPYCKRATLHDLILTPDYAVWNRKWRERLGG
ncbi:MAG: hypothetical protein IT210_15375 [Armatimonadetes bacterium]|nr:hypothetical protein [Armatimonadota bacterium]